MAGDWPGMQEAMPWAYAGGAGLIGRLMYHAQQVQRGKRKPFSVTLLFDLPIALAMGWLIYGLAVWLKLAPEPTVSLAIAAAYLGPYSVDRIFGRLADRYLGKEAAE